LIPRAPKFQQNNDQLNFFRTFLRILKLDHKIFHYYPKLPKTLKIQNKEPQKMDVCGVGRDWRK
jgi:predicted methyltransferase